MGNDINNWLSRIFRKSECYQFLEHIINQNEEMFNCIDWSLENYYNKINGNFVKYNYDPETENISVRVGNNERKIDITISNYGDSIDIRDRKKYSDKEKIDIHHIIHNTNKTSYYNHKNITKYNNGIIKRNYDRKLHIDDYTKKVINYYESDIHKKGNNKVINKQKVLSKKPRRKIRVWHHY